MVAVHLANTPDGQWDESRGSFALDPDGTYGRGRSHPATRRYGRHTWTYVHSGENGAFNPFVQHQGHLRPSELVEA